MMYRVLKRYLQHHLFVLMGIIWVGSGFLHGCSWIETNDKDERLSSSDADPEKTISTELAFGLAPSTSSLAQNSNGHEPQSETGHRLSTLNDLASGDQKQPLGRLPLGIIPATTEAGRRTAQNRPGRSDPFAPLSTTPILVQRSNSRSSSPGLLSQVFPSRSTPHLPSSPRLIEPVPLSSPPELPSISVISSSQLLSGASSAPSAPSALLPISPQQSSQLSPETVLLLPESAPMVSDRFDEAATLQESTPASVSAAIEFSGVVQVGNQISLIVQEPGDSNSRYIQVGDRVANGQFIVKAVDFGRGPMPAVILEQSGTEIVHWVGRPASVTPGM